MIKIYLFCFFVVGVANASNLTAFDQQKLDDFLGAAIGIKKQANECMKESSTVKYGPECAIFNGRLREVNNFYEKLMLADQDKINAVISKSNHYDLFTDHEYAQFVDRAVKRRQNK